SVAKYIRTTPNILSPNTYCMFVAPDSHCEICVTSRNLEVHHIEPKRMGGSRRPEIEAPSNKATLCRSCHTQITEQRWRLERTDRQLIVTDVPTGEVLARRLFDPDFSAPGYFQELNLLENRLDALVQGIPYLTDDQLVDLFSYLRSLDQHTWKAQAAILWEAKRRSVYGDRAWEAMGRSFGIGWRQAYNLAQVWEVFFLGEKGQFCNQLQNSTLQEVTWYIVASQTDVPHFWLAYADDRKAEDPGYSVTDFKDEIGIAGANKEDPLFPESDSQRCQWLRVYCMKLRRVVRPGQCPGCDTGVPSIQEAAS
ncbi:MAG: HNH endonuclease, partial [Dehalococcoidia bacterium]